MTSFIVFWSNHSAPLPFLSSGLACCFTHCSPDQFSEIWGCLLDAPGVPLLEGCLLPLFPRSNWLCVYLFSSVLFLVSLLPLPPGLDCAPGEQGMWLVHACDFAALALLPAHCSGYHTVNPYTHTHTHTNLLSEYPSFVNVDYLFGRAS